MAPIVRTFIGKVIASLLLGPLLFAGCQIQPAAYGQDSGKQVATALLRVYEQPPSLLEPASDRSVPIYESTYRNTMAQLLTSHFVIERAIRPQEIAEIPQIESVDDPIQWVRERLEVDFPGNGEIMRVRMADDGLSADALEKLVDSIVAAFLREVVDSERTERLRTKEVLNEVLQSAREDLRQRREEYYQLAAELGEAESPAARIRLEMAYEQWRASRAERRDLQRRLADAYLKHRLELLEAGALTLDEETTHDPSGVAEDTEGVPPRLGELMAVDEEELGAAARERIKHSRATYAVVHGVIEAQIKALDQQAEELKRELDSLSRPSAELQARRDDLKQRARLVEEMAEQLARWDVELMAGSRVRPVQSAVAERSGQE